jgi:hypothetical protein
MLSPSNVPHSREAYWRRHVLAQHASRLGIAEYCRRHSLHGPNFYVWRKRLGLKAAADPRPPVRTSPASPTRTPATPAFVAVELPVPAPAATPAPAPALTLHLPGERRLEIAEHCNPTLLRTVLAALEGRPC